jgi:hypothetical protein
MFLKINPSIVVINGKHYNVENIYAYTTNNLSIQLDYFSGDKELLQFGSKQELNKALAKLKTAQESLDYGVNYAAR